MGIQHAYLNAPRRLVHLNGAKPSCLLVYHAQYGTEVHRERTESVSEQIDPSLGDLQVHLEALRNSVNVER